MIIDSFDGTHDKYLDSAEGGGSNQNSKGDCVVAKEKQEIIDEITTHIQRCGGNYSAWYVGISKDAKDRLFNGHNIREKKDAWIFRTACSSQVARDIEEYFVNTLDTDGGTGGGDNTSDIVYAYKKAAHTNP